MCLLLSSQQSYTLDAIIDSILWIDRPRLGDVKKVVLGHRPQRLKVVMPPSQCSSFQILTTGHIGTPLNPEVLGAALRASHNQPVWLSYFKSGENFGSDLLPRHTVGILPKNKIHSLSILLSLGSARAVSPTQADWSSRMTGPVLVHIVLLS